MSIINQLTAQQLRWAADLKDKIAALQKQLGQLTGAGGASAARASVEAAKPARRKISAAGIAKIRAAQKARWAKIKGTTVEPVLAQRAAPKKRTLSTVTRAKMAAAAEARWAKIKGAKK